MLKILFDHSIPNIEELFSSHFELSSYQHQSELKEQIRTHDILICRATTQITPELIKHSAVQCIATASSGSDHIHIQNPKIKVMDAKGGNAHAVGDYILCTLAELNIVNKTSIGIIGHGHVGKALNLRLKSLGFDVKVYAPTHNLPTSFSEMMQSNVILVHPNYHTNPPYSTHHLLSHDFFKNISEQTVVINASRGKILDEQALLASSWKGVFCTDVYQNEPDINPDIMQRASICTPHIAGHTIEAKSKISEILAKKIHEYFKKKFEVKDHQNLTLISQKNWQEEVLKIYSPKFETDSLKKDSSAKHFLELRKAHLRHEFEIALN
jgi:erythronate-4-phosphate dehydrogenase